jgi:hypothetical protein
VIVEVDVPNLECFAALGLGSPSSGVEELVGEDPVVAFHLAVVARSVGRDELMLGAV